MSAPANDETALLERCSTGIADTGNPGLDAMSGGGLAYGASTLFVGPSGVGKTTTAMSCVSPAVKCGEQISYYLFDEGISTLMQRCEALGLGVKGAVANGQLELVQRPCLDIAR